MLFSIRKIPRSLQNNPPIRNGIKNILCALYSTSSSTDQGHSDHRVNDRFFIRLPESNTGNYPEDIESLKKKITGVLHEAPPQPLVFFLPVHGFYFNKLKDKEGSVQSPQLHDITYNEIFSIRRD